MTSKKMLVKDNLPSSSILMYSRSLTQQTKTKLAYSTARNLMRIQSRDSLLTSQFSDWLSCSHVIHVVSDDLSYACQLVIDKPGSREILVFYFIHFSLYSTNDMRSKGKACHFRPKQIFKILNIVSGDQATN